MSRYDITSLVNIGKEINTNGKPLRKKFWTNRASPLKYTQILTGNTVEIFVKQINFNPESEQEFISGNKINQLRALTPTFPYTYGWFSCLNDFNDMAIAQGYNVINNKYIAIEYIPGKTLGESNFTDEEYVNIVKIIVLSLNLLFKETGLIHPDLHDENIICQQLPETITIFGVETSILPVIIDFDRMLEGYDKSELYKSYDYLRYDHWKTSETRETPRSWTELIVQNIDPQISSFHTRMGIVRPFHLLQLDDVSLELWLFAKERFQMLTKFPKMYNISRINEILDIVETYGAMGYFSPLMASKLGTVTSYLIHNKLSDSATFTRATEIYSKYRY